MSDQSERTTQGSAATEPECEHLWEDIGTKKDVAYKGCPRCGWCVPATMLHDDGSWGDDDD